MLTFKEATKWCKYSLIIVYSILTDKSVVNMFGSTYIVYGNAVQKIKEKQ